MKTMKKICGVMLAAAMIISTSVTTTFAAISVPKSQTVYQTSSTGSSWVSIPVSGLTKKQSVSKASVKSSNSAVLALDSVSRSVTDDTTQYFTAGSKDSSYSYVWSSIGLTSKKAGKSTISFKVGNKSYSSVVTVKKYVNPLKSFTITGISGDQASKFKSQAYANTVLQANGKKGTVAIKAKSGWKITSVSISDRIKGSSLNFSSYSKGVTSVKVPMISGLKKTGRYNINVSFVNTKNQGSLSISYAIGNN